MTTRTRTRLEILDSRHAGVNRMPTPWQELHDWETRRDTYAENLVGQGHYRDEGCDLAPACLSCPFDPCRYEWGLDSDVRRAERNAAIWADYQRMNPGKPSRDGSAPRAVGMLADKYGVSRRSIHRVIANAKKGIGITAAPKQKPRPADSHKWLTSGIFKQRVPWPELFPAG